MLFSLPLESLTFDKTFCVLKVNFGGKEYLHYFERPKDLKLKNGEIELELETEIEKAKTGFWIKVSSKTLQKNVFLMADEKGKFHDNFFDLLPNESKTIFFSTESKTAPKFTVKTLNQFISK